MGICEIERPARMSELENARRTIDKADDVLRRCAEYFERHAAMNAAMHMSDNVLHSPLHAAIASTLNGINTFKASYPQETSQ